MPYAILRAKKLKTPAALARSMRHTYREVPVPNADPKAPPPQVAGPRTTAEGMARARERWPEKRRKDAVLAIEYLVTASPEAFKRHGGQLDEAKYFNGALDWLKSRHGAENVIGAAVHRDETSPHMVVYVVPRDGERLNCRKFLGGSACLSQMQDDFYQACGQPLGLERGIKGSKAKHTTIKQFYTAARKAGEIPELSKADLAAAAVGIHTDAYKEAQEAARNAAKASTLAHLRARAAQAREKALERQEKALATREKDVGRRLDVAEEAFETVQRMERGLDASLDKERRKTEEAKREAEAERERNARLRRELAEAEAARKRLLERNRELEAKAPRQNRPELG